MMKKVIVGGIAVLMLTGAAVGGVFADSSNKGVQKSEQVVVQQQQVQTESAKAKVLLTKEEVIQIAKNKVDGEVKEVELEREKGQNIYEVEMKNGKKEVDLKIDAITGEILKIEVDWDDDDQPKQAQNKSANVQNKVVEQNKQAPVQNKVVEQNKQAPAQNKVVEQKKPAQVQNKTEQSNQTSVQKKKSELITREEAIQIAKSIADGRIEEVELDEDDGRLIYEIEIENGEFEVEIEIDARTGKVLDVEYDD